MIEIEHVTKRYDHLLAMAQTHGLGRSRVDEVIDLVGLASVARKRAGGFSLGMGQRLGIASALLGDPQTLILDEPTNGIDPEGIMWIRTLLKGLAAEGRTVFLSSHLMSEMALTADHLVIIGRGRLIADTTVEDVVRQASEGAPVRVRTPQPEALRDALAGPDVAMPSSEHDVLDVTGGVQRADRRVAAAGGIVLTSSRRHAGVVRCPGPRGGLTVPQAAMSAVQGRAACGGALAPAALSLRDAETVTHRRSSRYRPVRRRCPDRIDAPDVAT